MAERWKNLLAMAIVMLQLSFGQSQQAPRIVEEPADTVVGRHQPATLECRAEGNPTPKVKWFKDGADLQSSGAASGTGSRRVILPAGGLFFLRATHARRDSDAGMYWCEATNQYGTVRSRNATLQVAVLREDFRLEPVDTHGAVGDTALLECAPPRGTPEPSVSWRKNGQVLDLDESERISVVDGGNLVIQDLRSSDDGRYQCLAMNVVGSRESIIARLRVYVKPYLVAGPEDATALSGGSVTFSCRAGGEPLPDVLWRRTADGGNMPLGRVRILEDRSLRLDDVTPGDQGDYICEADNLVGTVSAWGTLTVHSLPTVQLRPLTQTIEEGRDAHFECFTKGTPSPKIHWSIDANHTIIFPGTNMSRFYATKTEDGESRLILKNASKTDSNTGVVCSAVNVAGSAIGRTKLVVTSEDDRPPPVIIIGPSNQTLPYKSMAVLPCSAQGNPTPVITWSHHSSPIIVSERVQIDETGTMSIKNLNSDDNGWYTCTASSKNGKSSWSGNLIVDAPTNPSVNFFRGPDFSALPGPPSRPQIRNQSDSSVTITWTQNNKIGSSSLLGYRVEMFSRQSGYVNHNGGWTVVARRVLETTYTQRILAAGGAYVFLVRAENSHGLSPPSALSETVLIDGNDDIQLNIMNGIEMTKLSEARARLHSEDVVQLSEAIALDSTTIKLVWRVTNSDYLEGFYIYYIPVNDFNTSDHEYKSISVLYSSDPSSFQITNLMKYTEYEFFVIPFYKHIQGKPSNSKITKTLEDLPESAPVDLEASLINSTAIFLKWRPPPEGTHNGAIQYYQVVVKEAENNESKVVHNVSVVGGSVRLGGLTAGAAYSLRLAAATSRGLGPFTSPAALRLPADLNPSSKILNHHNRHQVGHNLQSVVSGDLLSETWFLALLGSMLTIMILLFVAMLFVRRRHLLMKENPLPNLYDPRNGGKGLVNHLNIKAAMGLPHPVATGFKQGNNIKTDSLLWVKSRPDSWRSAKETYGMPEYNQPPLPEYDKINNHQTASEYDRINQQAMPDYAEVDASMITFRKGSFGGESATSPAAYASVTLVPSPGINTSSMEWTNRYTKSNANNKSSQDQDEEIYPASNGGYFNRNLFTESYFANQNSNPPKFTNAPRSTDKSNLSLQSEGNNIQYPGVKGGAPHSDQSYSLPQNHFGTARRPQRQKRHKFDVQPTDCNPNAENSANEPYNIRMQENPTFGLPDDACGAYLKEDCGDYCQANVQPMRLLSHQYVRPTNLKTADPNPVQVFASFKSRYKEPEYHASTRSEPGQKL